jgi:tetratricopeptide (TPR) repeat protein
MGDDAARAHELATLSSDYCMAGRLDDAIRVAQQALALAKGAGDERAEAHACMSLGTTRLTQFSNGDDAQLGEAMNAIERAAELYQRLGRIDFGAAVLTMAEASRMVGELDAAEALYRRVIVELGDPRWAEWPAHCRHLQARGSMGLGAVALQKGDRKQASAQFQAAAQLFLTANPAESATFLEELADLFESELRDREAAAAIRAALSGRVR